MIQRQIISACQRKDLYETMKRLSNLVVSQGFGLPLRPAYLPSRSASLLGRCQNLMVLIAHLSVECASRQDGVVHADHSTVPSEINKRYDRRCLEGPLKSAS